jgi:hypothetical protein
MGRTGGSPRIQFVIDGVLSERSLAAFPELNAVRDERHRRTVLDGESADPTAMRSILARIDDLGFTLLEMRRLPG